MDFVAACLEEIALEGLDGITLEALWLRLKNRHPVFSLPVDDYAKVFLWENVIVKDDDLEFFELSKERKPLILFNRFDYIDEATGIVLEQAEIEDIYPINIVDDTENTVRGSCSTYTTRTNITQHIRDNANIPQLTLTETVERWGEKMVIVASQDLRCKTIVGEEKTEVGTKMPVRIYIFLERVARSRWHGEITHGFNSLKCLNDSPKSLFYIRKKLRTMDLISDQIFNSRLRSGQNVGGTLIHLKRYFVEHQSPYVRVIAQICSYLEKMPLKMEQTSILREHLKISPSKYKRAIGYATSSKVVELLTMRYRELYPEATKKDYETANGLEKSLRVVRLLRVYKSRDLVEENIDSDEEEATAGKEFYDLVYEKPIIDQAHDYLLQKGMDGISQTEIAAVFNITKLESRMICRYLEREEVVKKILLDQGKQRVQKYVAKENVESCNMIKNMKKEMFRILAPNSSPIVSSSLDDTTTQTDDSVLSVAEQSQILFDSEWHNAKKGDAHITQRWLKRADLIMEHIKDVKIMDNHFMLKKKIIEMEEKQGFKTIADKKSVMRIVNRLQQSGQLHLYTKTVNISDTQTKEVNLICDKEIKEDDQIIKSYLKSEEQKIRALNQMHEDSLKRKQEAKEKSQNIKDVNEHDFVTRDPAELNYALLTSKMMLTDMKYDNNVGRRYGYKPKYRRVELLHKYLWYLVYGYDMADNSDLSELEVNVQLDLEDTVVTVADPIPDSVLSTYKVYSDDKTWKRFVPPIPKHKGYPIGWFLTGDILLVMPVSIFVSLVRLNYRIPGLMNILQDPIRRHVTVSQLPSAIRQAVMVNRKYLFNVGDIMTQLCQMGMLSYGGRDLREKHQVYAFLHQNVSYVDTTERHEDDRQIHMVKLNSYEAVSKFWFSIQYTAINTAIASVKEPKSRSTSGELTEKFKSALEAKSPDTVRDLGFIPGDGKGACGFDSCGFLHLKRNWYWNYDNDLKVCAMLDTANRISEEGTRGPRIGVKKLIKIPHILSKKPVESTTFRLSSKKEKIDETVSKKRSPRVRKPKPKYEKIVVSGEAAIPKKGGKGIKRKPENKEPEVKSPPKKKVRKEDTVVRIKKYATDERGKQVSLKGYDAIDEAILMKRDRERVEWCDEEDSLVLMMAVTQRFLLYPLTRRDNLVSYYFLRDLLHEQSSRYRNKSSKAIQRRLKYILKNKQTEVNTEVFVGEALQDAEMFKKYKENKTYNKTLAPGVLENSYRSVYYDLKNRFSTQKTSTTVTLPDSLQELDAKYHLEVTAFPRVSRFVEASSTSDICFWVLHNVIHCSMLLHDKSGRAHELFQLFNQYPEELLLAVFNCMRTDSLVTKLKDKVFKSAKVMPWNRISIGNPGFGGYQVSQRYMYHWFAKQYPQQVFEHANNVLEMFLENPNNSLDMEEKGGFAAATVALWARRQIKFETIIPEHIISMQAKPAKADIKEKDGLPAAMDSDEEIDDQLLAEAEKERKTEIVEHFVNLAEKKIAAAATDSHIEFQQESVKSTSRTILNLMHSTYYGYYNIRGYNPDRNLVVNGCNVQVKLKEEALPPKDASPLIKDMAVKVRGEINKYNSRNIFIHPHSGKEVMKAIRMTYPSQVDIDDVIEECKQKYAYGTEDLREFSALCEVIKEPGSLGISHRELQQYSQTMARFEDHKNILIENKIVSRNLDCGKQFL